MYSLGVVLLAAGALAGNLHQLVPRELHVRQSEAFRPDRDQGRGATCADAFGAGYIDCNGVCYNPNQGQTCCPGGGDAYPCIRGSYCLNVNDLCCPNGLDPATCARRNRVSLPANTATSATSGSTTAHSSTISAVETTATDTSSAFVPSVTATTIATPYPIPGNETSAATATGTNAPSGTGAPGSGGVTPFTGAASGIKVVGAGLVAGFAGVVVALLL